MCIYKNYILFKPLWLGMAQDATNSPSDQAELTNAEVVEKSPETVNDLNSLSTFTKTQGPFSYKVLPNIKGGSTVWRVVVYMTGVQGPVYESEQGVTDEAADHLRMSRRLQERINEAHAYAQSELEIPTELGDQTRAKRGLNELETLMEGE